MTGGWRAAYHRQQFDPAWWGVFVNPFYFARRALRAAVERHASAITGRVLDVGCGSRPYEALFTRAQSYVGMDVERLGHDHTGERVDVYYDGKRFPFPAGAFDALVCFEVLEHVFEPEPFLAEAARVVRPGGSLLFTVPFVWDEHEQPYDYARYSSFGLRALFARSGLTVISESKYLTDLRLLVLLINSYVYRFFRKRLPPRWFLVPTLLLTSLTNLLGLLLMLLPKSDELYFGNIVVLRVPERVLRKPAGASHTVRKKGRGSLRRT